MKIKHIINNFKPGENLTYTIEFENGIRWDIEWFDDGEYYLDCHVFGPDDFDEWRENAKSMLAFTNILEALQIELNTTLNTTVENFGNEAEIAASIYLTESQFNFLNNKYGN